MRSFRIKLWWCLMSDSRNVSKMTFHQHGDDWVNISGWTGPLNIVLTPSSCDVCDVTVLSHRWGVPGQRGHTEHAELQQRVGGQAEAPEGLQDSVRPSKHQTHQSYTSPPQSECHTCRSDTCRSDAWRRQFYLCSSLMLFASTDRFSSCGHMGAHCRTWPQTSRERHSSDTLILTWAAATISVIIILSLNQSISQSDVWIIKYQNRMKSIDQWRRQTVSFTTQTLSLQSERKRFTSTSSRVQT